VIRKFARLDAPPEVVARMFHDLESWPGWMAGMRSVRILERRDPPEHPEAVRVVEVVQVQAGRTLRQTLECRLEPRGLVQRQVRGRLRRWDATWRFMEPPDGRGTTISLELEIELGLLGAVIPTRMVQAIIDDIFVATVRTARQHCRELLAEAAARAGWPEKQERHDRPPGDELVLELLAHPDHLELRLDGRRYRLVEIEDP
jgi:hypothetical protein